jgi:2-C-methyl-D-erythritol 2,4-cyclodiphosphate synthase
MMTEAGFVIENVDATIVAEVPRLAQHQKAMHESLSALLGVSLSLVNLKLTSTDKLGAIGRGEGIAGMAVVLLKEAKG